MRGAGGEGVPKDWRPVALLAAGTAFMEILDATIITTALPQMAVSFRVLPVDVNVGITAYMMTLAVIIPLSGWAVDRFGARRVFTAAVALFTLASLLCAASTTLAQFTAARVLQGIGGALTVPVGRLIVLRASARRDLIAAVAYLTWPALLAPIIAPALGGYITEHFSWHWIFLINVPLGLIALALAFVLVPKGERQTLPFDRRGFALTALASVALLYGLEHLGGESHAAWIPWALIAAATVLIWLAVRHFRRFAHPLIDLAVLRIPTFAVTVTGGTAVRAAISALPFLLPLMFQEGFGMGPLASGLMLAPLFIGNALMKVVTTPILHAFGFRRTLLVSGAFAAAALAGMAFMGATTPALWVSALLFFSGLTRSMQFTALNTLGFADVPVTQTAVANTFAAMVGELSAALGVAIGALALRLGTVWHGTPTATIVDYHFAFWVMAGIALIGALDALRLGEDAGAEVRSRGLRGGR